MIIEHQRAESAFSLLELIVASLMFSIVLASISTAFFGAHRLKRTSEAELLGEQEIRRAINLMKRDLRSVTLPTTNDTTQITVSTEDSETNSVTFSGAMVTGTGANGAAMGSTFFEFYTTSGLRLFEQPWIDIQRVIYTVRPPTNARNQDGNELIRTVTRNILAGVEQDYSERVLLRGVEHVYYEFWTGDEWLDYWDSTTLSPQAPEAIRTTITMMRENNSEPAKYVQLVTPVLLQPLTNTVQSVNGGNG